MELFFIRHGQSVNNKIYADTGSPIGRFTDAELTDLGQQQAELMGTYAQSLDLTHVYCSLMVRAIDTATAITKRNNLPLVAWPDLHELGGIFQYDDEMNRVSEQSNGRSFFTNRFPHLTLPNGFDETGWWNAEMSDTWPEIGDRAERVVEGLTADHANTEDRVALVAHAGFYNSVVRCLFRMPLHEIDNTLPVIRFQLNNTAISHFSFIDHKNTPALIVRQLNQTHFLPDDLVS